MDLNESLLNNASLHFFPLLGIFLRLITICALVDNVILFCCKLVHNRLYYTHEILLPFLCTSAAGWFFENKAKFSVCQLQDLAMDVSGRCIPGILNGL